MKTLIIYNSIDAPLQYAIVEGDYSDLNGVCINSLALIYDPTPYN